MWSVDRMKTLGVRALVDVLVLGVIGVVVVLALWAYHGQQAFVYIQNVVAQQQRQQTQQSPARPQTPPEPTQPPPQTK